MPKALILREFKEYGDFSALNLEDVDVPEPGEGEISIDVEAFALNYGDFELFTGEYTFRLELPSRVGDECAGTVRAIGPGVTGFKVGDRVSTMPIVYGKNGVNGEVACYDARYCAHVPDNISSVEACAVWVSYFTAYAAMIEVATVHPTDYVLITAGSSNAGYAAMEICRHIGAVTIATTRSASRKEEIRKLGYDYVIAQDSDDMSVRINEISHGRGARVIYDPVGGKIVQEYKDALGMDAIIFLYGGMDQSETIVPENEMTQKNACLLAFSIFRYITKEDIRSRGVSYIQEGLAEGRLNPRVGDVYDLKDWRVALEAQYKSEAAPGKLVIQTPLGIAREGRYGAPERDHVG